MPLRRELVVVLETRPTPSSIRLMVQTRGGERLDCYDRSVSDQMVAPGDPGVAFLKPLPFRAVGPPPTRPAPGAELVAGGRRLLEELVGVGARSLGDAEAAEHPRHLLAAGLAGEGLDQRLRAPVALGLFDVAMGAGEGADVGQVRLLADRHALDAAGEPRGA